MPSKKYLLKSQGITRRSELQSLGIIVVSKSDFFTHTDLYLVVQASIYAIILGESLCIVLSLTLTDFGLTLYRLAQYSKIYAELIPATLKLIAATLFISKNYEHNQEIFFTPYFCDNGRQPRQL